MKKRILSVFLIITIMATVTGCGGSSNPPEEERTERQTTTVNGNNGFFHDITPVGNNSSKPERWEYIMLEFKYTRGEEENEITEESGYYIVKGNNEFLMELTNQFGADGWELVSMGIGVGAIFIFKRRLP
ncbi:MAG: hypothetical protein FWD34_09840 [Oscillospiraceae bacterium]|nr:hypothetical protein [Oscillospiraceae bacterium]